MMNISIPESRLRIVNFSIVAFFVTLFLLYTYDVRHDLIDALRELFTIPFLIALVVFLPLSLYLFIRERYNNPVTIISIIALLICAIITIGSFF